jgi:hypothetical protein
MNVGSAKVLSSSILNAIAISLRGVAAGTKKRGMIFPFGPCLIALPRTPRQKILSAN